MTEGKIRTRAHIIGDLGYNWTERQVLLAGYVMNHVSQDYGHDGIVSTFDENGILEFHHIFIQVKSTEKIKFSKKHNGYEVILSKRDLIHWVNSQEVVLAVLCDVEKNVAYYVHIQEYFKEYDIKNILKFITVFIPEENVFNPKTVEKFRIIKNSNYENYRFQS